jgi:hypothetical protein
MKLVGTSVRPELVGRVVDILRMLGYTHVGVGRDQPAAPLDGADAVRVEVLVKEVDAPGVAVALSRATSKDPHPVFVTDVVSGGALTRG